MAYEIDKATLGIFSWIGNRTPTQDLPQGVRDRINWAVQLEKESGLTFMGAMRAVLADPSDDGIANMLDYCWLEPTQEFIEWRDGPTYRLREMQIAVELLYGTQDGTEMED